MRCSDGLFCDLRIVQDGCPPHEVTLLFAQLASQAGAADTILWRPYRVWSSSLWTLRCCLLEDKTSGLSFSSRVYVPMCMWHHVDIAGYVDGMSVHQTESVLR